MSTVVDFATRHELKQEPAPDRRLQLIVDGALRELEDLINTLLIDGDGYIHRYAEWVLKGRPLSGQPRTPAALPPAAAKMLREIVLEQAALDTRLNARDLHGPDRRHG